MRRSDADPAAGAQRWLAVATMALGIVAAVFVPTPPAHAATDPHFSRYWVTAQARADGTLRVELDLEYDFDGRLSRGIVLTYGTAQPYDGTHHRRFTLSDVTVASASGAPTDLAIEQDTDQVLVRIGDADQAVLDGVETYQVAFTVDGLINPGVGDGGEDEILWNVIGNQFTERLEDVRVEVIAPHAPLAVACRYGLGSPDEPCDSATVEGEAAVFTHGDVNRWNYVTVGAQYPPGTFPGATLRLHRTAAFGGWPAALAAVVIAIGVGAIVTILRRRGERDLAFVGLTPGVLPGRGETPRITRAPRNEVSAVRFTPPADAAGTPMSPALVSAIVNKQMGEADIAATILALATRGFLRIESVESGGRAHWRLHQVEGVVDASLPEHERRVRDLIVGTRADPVQLSDLDEDEQWFLHNEVQRVNDELLERGWFAHHPARARGNWATTLTGWGLAGVFTLTAAHNFGFGWAGVAPWLILPIRLAFPSAGEPRTALGHAVYVQAMGFKTYLETAEVEQLAFEAGRDIFSEYLPYAMALGVERAWTTRFAELAAQGRWQPRADWYLDGDAAMRYGALFARRGHGLMSALARFRGATSSAVTAGAPRAGSTGRSGFRRGSGGSVGGGLSAGGGAGGGGGGRW